MPRTPARIGEKPQEKSQEARVLSLLQAAPGDVVPTAHIIQEIFPASSRTRRSARNLVGENVRRIRERGWDVRTVKGQGYRLNGASPGAVPIDMPTHSKPRSKGAALEPRPCKPGCGKTFTPGWPTNYQCRACAEKASKLGSNTFLMVPW